MKRFVLLIGLAILSAVTVVRGGTASKLELRDGDRVALIGNTFVEREGQFGYIETALLTRFPDRNVTFRNLGYSADTATGSARGLCVGWSLFESPDKAFERLRKLVAEFKPTVLLINYGMTESFSGPQQLPEFDANYNKMLDALGAAAGSPRQIILMSPNYHEDLGKPLPDPSEHNKNLRLYSAAIADIASKRGAMFIDLFSITEAAGKTAPLTWNGIHLTQYGYWQVSLAISQSLGLPITPSHIEMDASAKVVSATGTVITDAKALSSGISFTRTNVQLPACPAPNDSPKGVRQRLASKPGDQYAVILEESPILLTRGDVLQISGLKAGTYELIGDGEKLAAAPAESWAKGVPLLDGPEVKQAESLRTLVVAKNFDFFNYQRPDNDSYILAFRKREQGRNAVEIPEFLPLMREKENQIAAMRVPKAVHYVLQAVK